MKRSVALVLLLAACIVASAQKGKYGIGFDACLVDPFDNNNIPGVSIKVQYNLSDVFRIEPTASTFFSSLPYKQSDNDNREEPYVSFGLNLHTTFLKINHRRWQLYLITGAAYSQLRHKENYSYKYNGNYVYSGDLEIGNNQFGANIGLGTLYRIHRQINLNIDATYDSVLNGCFKAGIVYNFN